MPQLFLAVAPTLKMHAALTKCFQGVSGSGNRRGRPLAAALAATARGTACGGGPALAATPAPAAAAAGALASLAADGRAALQEAATWACATAIAAAPTAAVAAAAEAAAHRARPAPAALDELRLLLHHGHLGGQNLLWK